VLDRSLGVSELPISDRYNLYHNIFYSPYEFAEGGHLHREYLFKFIKPIYNQWCYMLDDDNLLHPKLIEFFLESELKCDAYLFALLDASGKQMFPAIKEGIKIGRVDTAMLLFKLKCTEGFKFQDRYHADGEFIMNVYQKYNMCFVNQPMAYYNKLRA
jgi:hypothetical protein